MENVVTNLSNFTIHPTAIIGDQVRLGSGVSVGPFSVLQGTIEIGNESQIGAHCTFYGDIKIGEKNSFQSGCTINGNISIGKENTFGCYVNLMNNVKIGDKNTFTASCSIGSVGEMGTKGDKFLEHGSVDIGNHNVIREFVTINSPVRLNKTVIGDRCYLMSRTHIPHDAILENGVTMATNSLIGGGVHVGENVYIGLASITHQWLKIGASAMLGMNATVTKNIPPFCTVVGIPAKIQSLNKVGALRKNYDQKDIDETISNFDEILQGQYHNKQNPMISMMHDFIQENVNTLTSKR